MATQSPFLLLEDFLKALPLPDLQPPVWAIDEAQRRIVLLLNHILCQEKEAMSRLARQKDRVVQLQWRSFSLRLVATAAGLLDLTANDAKADLVLAVTEESALALAQGLLRGNRPAVRIAGDVQLAAEVNWLVDHVRWDLEEDLARVIGDAPAHTLGEGARAMVKTLRQFVGAASDGSSDKAGT
jgi:ubiquinone biosynthesis accessory factor UbiJ